MASSPRRQREMMRRLRRLAALSPAELLELLEAQGVLLHAQCLRWLRPIGAFVSKSAPRADPREGELPEGDEEVAIRAGRVALAVERAAAHGVFRPACLVRSIALIRMLEARGIQGSQLRVGVRWEGEHFTAHAWVEHGGRVLGDRPANVSRYTPLSNVEVLRGVWRGV